MKRAMLAAILAGSLAACGDSGSTRQENLEDAPKPGAVSEAPKADAGHEDHAKMTEAAPAAELVARTPSPAGAKVYFISPANGDTIHGPVPVKFGIEGMKIVPAGTDSPNSGHYHILIDTKLADYNAPILADEMHRHYGAGQTETALGLPPGKHTLQILLGDKDHVPHDPPVESKVITITVD